jgi:hypothetical protein
MLSPAERSNFELVKDLRFLPAHPTAAISGHGQTSYHLSGPMTKGTWYLMIYPHDGSQVKPSTRPTAFHVKITLKS